MIRYFLSWQHSFLRWNSFRWSCEFNA
jgi:hypothetical protein